MSFQGKNKIISLTIKKDKSADTIRLHGYHTQCVKRLHTVSSGTLGWQSFSYFIDFVSKSFDIFFRLRLWMQVIKARQNLLLPRTEMSQSFTLLLFHSLHFKHVCTCIESQIKIYKILQDFKSNKKINKILQLILINIKILIIQTSALYQGTVEKIKLWQKIFSYNFQLMFKCKFLFFLSPHPANILKLIKRLIL